MKEYQPRFVAFANSLGMTPEDLESCGNFKSYEFIEWIRLGLAAWAKAEGKDDPSPSLTESEHESFTIFLEKKAQSTR